MLSPANASATSLSGGRQVHSADFPPGLQAGKFGELTKHFATQHYPADLEVDSALNRLNQTIQTV